MSIRGEVFIYWSFNGITKIRFISVVKCCLKQTVYKQILLLELKWEVILLEQAACNEHVILKLHRYLCSIGMKDGIYY